VLPRARVGSASKEVDDGADLGHFEEQSELPTCSHARRALRPLQVHVSAARRGRMQVGSRSDPGVRHLRRVHSSPQGLRHVEEVASAARQVSLRVWNGTEGEYTRWTGPPGERRGRKPARSQGEQDSTRRVNTSRVVGATLRGSPPTGLISRGHSTRVRTASRVRAREADGTRRCARAPAPGPVRRRCPRGG